MKASKFASILLTATIAFMATGCTVEFSDPNGTVDKVVGVITEDTSNSGTQDTAPASGDNSTSSTESNTEAKATDNAEATNADTTKTTTAEESKENSKEGTTSTDVTEATESSKATTTEATEAQRTVILEDCCIQFDTNNTLDCKHGKFAIKAADKDIIITFNNKDFELPISWDNKEVWPYGAVYVQTNGNEYLYIGSSMQTSRGFYHNLNVYKIDGNNISYVGSTDGLAVISQNMTDPNWFVCSEVEAEENGFDIRGCYKVGPDGMPVFAGETKWFFSFENYVSFPNDVTGYKVVNETVTSETVTISADEYVRLDETDGKTFINVETKTNGLVRLDWTSIFQEREADDQFYIAHLIAKNIDGQIPSYEW